MASPKELWLRFRSSNAFMYTLGGALVLWFILRSFLHFDPDYTLLNLLLSIEAAVATCMILDQQVHSANRDRATLAHIVEMIAQLKSQDKKIDEVLDEVQED